MNYFLFNCHDHVLHLDARDLPTDQEGKQISRHEICETRDIGAFFFIRKLVVLLVQDFLKNSSNFQYKNFLNFFLKFRKLGEIGRFRLFLKKNGHFSTFLVLKTFLIFS